MKLILIAIVIASLSSQAGTVAEDLIALAANGASMGLYSRQLEVDIQKAKLEIEKEYALKMQDIMDQAKQNRMKILSEKLSQLKGQKIQVDSLKQKIANALTAFTRMNTLAKKSAENQLEVSAEILNLAASLSAQEASFYNLSFLVTPTQEEKELCQQQGTCELLLLEQKLNERAKALNLSVEELLTLGAYLSSPDQVSSLIYTSGVANEVLRNAKKIMTIKSNTIDVEILAIENALKELQK